MPFSQNRDDKIVDVFSPDDLKLLRKRIIEIVLSYIYRQHNGRARTITDKYFRIMHFDTLFFYLTMIFFLLSSSEIWNLLYQNKAPAIIIKSVT